MKKNTILIIFMLLLSISCNRDMNCDSNNVISYDFTDIESISDVTNNLSFIDITPMAINDDIAISDMCEVAICGDSYIFVDKMNKKIYRVGKDGVFKNMIGAAGNANNEYIDITSVQIIDESIYLYSHQGRGILIYDKDGNLKDRIEIKTRAQQYLVDGSDFYAYLGYNNGQMEARAIKTDLKGEIKEEYLHSDAKIIVFGEMNAPITKYNDRVYIRESYNNQINVITKDGSSTEVIYDFDFGKFNIPSTVFTQDDPFKGAEILLSSDFASINKLMNSRSSSIVHVTFQMASKKMIYNVIGISKNDENWRWITTSAKGENSVLFSTVKAVTDNNELLLLVNGYQLSELKKYYKDISDKSFESIGDNFAIVRLKIE